jgi:hypothetical protein
MLLLGHLFIQTFNLPSKIHFDLLSPPVLLFGELGDLIPHRQDLLRHIQKLFVENAG